MFLFNFPNSWETNNSLLVKKTIIIFFFIKTLIYSEHENLLPDAALHSSKQRRINWPEIMCPKKLFKTDKV